MYGLLTPGGRQTLRIVSILRCQQTCRQRPLTRQLRMWRTKGPMRMRGRCRCTGSCTGTRRAAPECSFPTERRDGTASCRPRYSPAEQCRCAPTLTPTPTPTPTFCRTLFEHARQSIGVNAHAAANIDTRTCSKRRRGWCHASRSLAHASCHLMQAHKLTSSSVLPGPAIYR
jgi:hypothetical protein